MEQDSKFQPELKFSDVIVSAGIELEDISYEEYREYVYFSTGDTYRVNRPVALHESESGAHYVVDAAGVVHYIKYGKCEIRWKPQPGQPHISFSDMKKVTGTEFLP